MNLESLKEIWNKIPKSLQVVLWVVSLAVTYYAGIFTNELSSYRSEQRQLLSAEYQEVQVASKKLLDTLQPLADAANGHSALREPDVQAFRKQVLMLHESAREVASRVPAVANKYDRYSASLISLKGAVEAMTGPKDAKNFVEAYADFVVAQEEFNQSIINEQRRFGWFPWTS